MGRRSRSGATLACLVGLVGLAGGVGTISACTAILGVDPLPDETTGEDASLDATRRAPGNDGGVTTDADASAPIDAAAPADAALHGDGEVTRSVPVGYSDLTLTLTPLGALYGDALRFGEAIAVSPDGTWLAIGAPGAARDGRDGGATGQVQLGRIDLDGGVGTIVLSLLDPGVDLEQQPQAGGAFGHSVAFSPDGKHLAVGAPQEPSTNMDLSGLVYVYALVSGSWQWAATVQPAPTSTKWFGNTVAFNATSRPVLRNILFVAATGDTTENDAGTSMNPAAVTAYVFGDAGLDATAFETLRSPSMQHDGFGWSLAVSSGADVILIGAPFAPCTVQDLPQGGCVYATSLASFQTRIYPDTVGSLDAGQLFGYSVALSPDETTAAIGAPRYDGQGALLFWDIVADAGPMFGTGVYGTEHPGVDGGRLGESVVMSADRVVGGAPLADNGTCTTVQLPIGPSPVVGTLPFAASAVPSGARYGAALALFPDGGFVAVGAPGTPGTPGGASPAVYLTR